MLVGLENKETKQIFWDVDYNLHPVNSGRKIYPHSCMNPPSQDSG